MRKKIYGQKLSRNRKAKKALFRSLIRGLVLGGKIKTTSAKAKSIEKQLQKLLKLSSDQSLSARRQAISILGNDSQVVSELFNQKFTNFKKTSILPRKGDNSSMVQIELIKNEKNIPSKI